MSEKRRSGKALLKIGTLAIVVLWVGERERI
jgi:hypothetical protein